MGRDSTLWKSIVTDRRLPEHYGWQIQHQLMANKADVADAYLFDGTEDVIFPLAPDPSTWPQIHVQCGGVAVTWFWTKGAVEYKRVPELAGINLAQYRGQGRRRPELP